MHNVPKNSETHFKVIIVSKEFESMSLIQRHRTFLSIFFCCKHMYALTHTHTHTHIPGLVNKALEVEFEKGMYALSITAKTPSQWEKSGQKVKPSPVCRGGDKTRF